ncbi:hypothetical protein HT594_00114 [Phenacoccus solenopsis nudivirus]|nr:hypothetical protein HT594_00114 [Phenacoccus solenopsis nudivirus]
MTTNASSIGIKHEDDNDDEVNQFTCLYNVDDEANEDVKKQKFCKRQQQQQQQQHSRLLFELQQQQKQKLQRKRCSMGKSINKNFDDSICDRIKHASLSEKKSLMPSTKQRDCKMNYLYGIVSTNDDINDECNSSSSSSSSNNNHSTNHRHYLREYDIDAANLPAAKVASSQRQSCEKKRTSSRTDLNINNDEDYHDDDDDHAFENRYFERVTVLSSVLVEQSAIDSSRYRIIVNRNHTYYVNYSKRSSLIDARKNITALNRCLSDIKDNVLAFLKKKIFEQQLMLTKS